MLEIKNLISRTDRLLPRVPPARNPEERKQRRMMVTALVLLLIALGFVLYRDRDFWFPETQEAEDTAQPQQTLPSASNPTRTAVAQPAVVAHKKSHGTKPQAKAPAPNQPPAAPPTSAQSASTEVSGPGLNAVTTRTVLPPLEVEVVAGDVHRTIHPGTNSVRVDLQPGSAPQQLAVPPAVASAASVTGSAAEHVQMSADTAEVVSRPVRPNYPLLARQMKVQGSVILQALIGRDGLIQDLHVLSGPPILASAAQEAVKQWHFKPHYLGEEAVETQARITVNFTISTN
jgi:periplasmic protein TonB